MTPPAPRFRTCSTMSRSVFGMSAILKSQMTGASRAKRVIISGEVESTRGQLILIASTRSWTLSATLRAFRSSVSSSAKIIRVSVLMPSRGPEERAV